MIKYAIEHFDELNFNSIKVRLEHIIDGNLWVANTNFNSIKVRLEHCNRRKRRCDKLDFNSIKVRLERGTGERSAASFTHFNSIKVRLERGCCSTWAFRRLFQFHKGAIRTLSAVKQARRLASFQFHKGAIRTCATLLCSSFLRRFQFHKGAIRTMPVPRKALTKLHFNSIKVRLERKRIDPQRWWDVISIP